MGTGRAARAFSVYLTSTKYRLISLKAASRAYVSEFILPTYEVLETNPNLLARLNAKGTKDTTYTIWNR